MTSDDTQQGSANEPAGQQLKKAREKQGLSVSQVADAQHLRSGIIQAIESGDYGQIDSELFLKGYVRAYAKQVGLNGDAIIADLNLELEPARLQKARELEANPLVNIERRRRRKRRIAKLLLLFIAAALIAALVIMVVMPKFNTDDAGAAGAESVGNSAEASSVSATNDLKSEKPSDLPEESIEIADAVSSDKSAMETESNSIADSSAVADSNNSAPAGTETVQPEVAEQEVPVVTPMTEPALARSLVLEPDLEPQKPESGLLEIEFTGDCWVQVRDASGNRLASSLQTAGDKLQVSGKAPLKVVIGAVDTVGTIRFQGELVDMKDFPAVNNRSEFTLTI